MAQNIKSVNYLNKVRSKYILIQIFEHLQQKRKLEIIRYNKNFKNKLKVKISDYKRVYSTIEIELIPKENEYGRFICLRPRKNEQVYKIYFNDSKEEINKFDFDKNDNVNKIKVILNHKLTSLYQLFLNCRCIRKIIFIKFNRNNISNMSKMFYGCSSLEELDISKLNTENTTSMNCMFYRCSSLEEINVSSFNTNKVTDMSYMFNLCSSLKTLNLSNFNTNNLLDMKYMFSQCSSLKELNISNFNTNKVNNMNHLFYYCSSLEELNISSKRYELYI